MGAVRSLAHGFLAAGDNDLGIAIENGLVAERNRAQARAAELVDAPGRAFDRDAGRPSKPGAPGSAPDRRWDLPRMTSETCAPSTPARLRDSAMATFPSSCAGTAANAPLKAPTGVRAALTTTISSFILELLFLSGWMVTEPIGTRQHPHCASAQMAKLIIHLIEAFGTSPRACQLDGSPIVSATLARRHRVLADSRLRTNALNRWPVGKNRLC